MYYLWGKGFDSGTKTTHFVTLNTSFSKLHISPKYYFNVSPQVYYLQQDRLKGVYAVAFLSLVKRDFPLSLAATFNKAIDTEVLPEKDFTWNVALVYSFPNRR